MRSAIVTRCRPKRSATSSRSGSRAIVPSAFMISQMTPARRQAGEAGEVDGGLGVTGALEHAAGLRAQREDVAGAAEVGGVRVGGDGAADAARAVRRRDAGVARLVRGRWRP